MFWLTHCRFGLFVVFVTFRVNFYHKKVLGTALLILACSLPVTPYSALCERGVGLSCLKPAGTDRQTLNGLMKVAESLSRARIFGPLKQQKAGLNCLFVLPIFLGARETSLLILGHTRKR